MIMKKELLNEVVTILQPQFTSQNDREAVLRSAFPSETALLGQVDYSGPAWGFTVRLVQRLETYGEVTVGNPAIVVLLESLKPGLGFDKRNQIDKLVEQLRNPSPETNKTAGTTPSQAAGQDASGISIFIGAAKADDGAARELYQTLQNEGYQPWLASIDLLPGQRIEQEIEKTLTSADFAIVLFSYHALTQRGKVQRQYRLALDTLKEWPDGDVFMIPVQLDDCEIPYSFREFYTVDYRQKKEAVAKILQVVQRS